MEILKIHLIGTHHSSAIFPCSIAPVNRCNIWQNLSSMAEGGEALGSERKGIGVTLSKLFNPPKSRPVPFAKHISNTNIAWKRVAHFFPYSLPPPLRRGQRVLHVCKGFGLFRIEIWITQSSERNLFKFPLRRYWREIRPNSIIGKINKNATGIHTT